MKPNIFFVHPFSDDFLNLYKTLKKRFEDNYSFVNALDMDNPRSVMKDIVEGIYKADVVIADLTGSNSNVYYELGLAHALGKKTIILTQAIDELPFDIRAYRVIEYSFNFWDIDSLIDELKKLLTGAIDGSIQFGNPVSDYIPESEIEKLFVGKNENSVDSELLNGVNETSDEILPTEGYLDLLTKIHDASTEFKNEFQTMAEEQNDLNSKIKSATDEINAVTVRGTRGPVLARNICRRLADDLDVYATSFSSHLDRVDSSWAKIENGMLSLLESRYVENEKGHQDLYSGISQLMSINSQIDVTNREMQSFSDSMERVKGVEKNLTKSIEKLCMQIARYITLTESMQSSLHRIKSRADLMDK